MWRIGIRVNFAAVAMSSRSFWGGLHCGRCGLFAGGSGLPLRPITVPLMEKPSVSLVSLLLVAVSLLGCALAARAQRTVVADSVTRLSLPSASVFDRDGRFAGISRADGRLPYVSPAAYPLTIRYIGYKEKVVPMTGNDTIFMQELSRELSEVVVESRSHKVLHMLAYVREYSTLTTYTDTVSLFREKMVDYMLPEGDTGSFKGWSNPGCLLRSHITGSPTRKASTASATGATIIFPGPTGCGQGWMSPCPARCAAWRWPPTR